MRFAGDGVSESNSDLIENALRLRALGKRKWLFIEHPTAGERNEVIDTLPDTCRRHGVNPFDYPMNLFARSPAARIAEIQKFKPSQWARARPTQLAPAT